VSLVIEVNRIVFKYAIFLILQFEYYSNIEILEENYNHVMSVFDSQFFNCFCLFSNNEKSIMKKKKNHISTDLLDIK